MIHVIRNVNNTKSGFIVREDGWINPISYGADEEWFSDYETAIDYAMNRVQKLMEELKTRRYNYSVSVFAADERDLHTSNPSLGEGVVFYWSNYKLICIRGDTNG